MGYRVFSESIGGTITNGKYSVTTSSSKIITADADLRTLILTNNSAYDVWLGLGEAAVQNEGLLLAAYGGIIKFDTDGCYKGDIYAIAIGSTTTIAYTKGVV